MEILDVKQLDEKQAEYLEQHILDIAEGAFVRQEFDTNRTNMDLACKQQYQDYYDVVQNPFYYYNIANNPNAANIQVAYDMQANRTSDEFSDLYLPILLTAERVLFVNIKNLCFPANGDWIGIERCYSSLMSELRLQKFIPFANDAWIKILKTLNQRYSFVEKYGVNLLECIRYGNTALVHTYNVDNNFVDITTPGIRNAGIFPLTDRWRESNQVISYDVNYNDLLLREDLDQDLIEQFAPSENYTQSQTLAKQGSNQKQQYDQYNLPYGKIRLYDVFMPSVYINPDDNGDPLIARNVYVTVAVMPDKKDDASADSESNVYILKANQNVDPSDHGLIFASYGQRMPGTFYHPGALIPFLPHQVAANQLFSGYIRTAANVAEPAFTRNTPDGIFDPETTPLNEYVRGAFYDNVNIEAIIRPDYAQAMVSSLNGLETISGKVETGVGISKAQQGVINEGRKSATEIKEAYSGSQLQLVEAAGQFDQQVLRPSISIRLSLTQKLLKEQIEITVQKLTQESTRNLQEGLLPAAPSPEALYEIALTTNPLFLSLLEQSGIKEAYEDFYKLTMDQFLKDQEILMRAEQLRAEIQSLLAMADPSTPLPPMPQPPGGIPPEQIQAAQQQYVMQTKQRAMMEAKTKELDLKRLELQFKGIQEPPQVSNKLLFDILCDPIKDSDIVVTGSMTTVSKEMARQNLNDFMMSVANYPPEAIAKMDFDGILMLQARANDLPLREIMKSPADLMRQEEAMQQQAAEQQMLIQQAAQVPGAQPAQFH